MTAYVVKRLLRGMRHTIEALEWVEEQLEQVLDRRALAEMSGDDHELDDHEAFAAEVDPWMTEPAREGEFDVTGAAPWE